MISKKSPSEYRDYAEKKSPHSDLLLNMSRAFLVGGLICVIGQLISMLLKSAGLGTDESAATTSIILIFTGAFLTGINVYDNIGHYAGAGSIVPITGFANSIVSPAMEFKKEGYVMGVGARMFTFAGPVIVYGVSASIAVGLIYFIVKQIIQ